MLHPYHEMSLFRIPLERQKRTAQFPNDLLRGMNLCSREAADFHVRLSEQRQIVSYLAPHTPYFSRSLAFCFPEPAGTPSPATIGEGTAMLQPCAVIQSLSRVQMKRSVRAGTQLISTCPVCSLGDFLTFLFFCKRS